MEYQFVVHQGNRSKIVGPRDRRLLTSRCDDCSRTHRKCSGDVKCSQCTQRGQQCTYSAKTRRRVLGSSPALGCFDESKVLLLVHPAVMTSLQDPDTTAIDYFFQRFIPTNSFSGHSATNMYDVHLYSQSCPQVYHAAVAVGALRICRSSITRKTRWSRIAFESCERSLQALHEHLQSRDGTSDRLQDLWTILLLGIFELMQDQTGQGFLQHMNIGAAQVVEYLGPDYFRCDQAKRYLREMRLIELNKSILLSQPSLFVRRKWRGLTEVGWADEEEVGMDPFGALPDIMACSCDFVIRAISVANKASGSTHITKLTLDTLVREACGLFDRLQQWSSTTPLTSDEDDTALLGTAYLSAISIYLSSPFDYFSVWSDYGVVTPALSRQAIHEHVDTIIANVDQVLQRRRVAGVMLLVPLRIAGARSRFDALSARRSRIQRLLEGISQTYAVSEAVLDDLTGIWRT